MCLCESVSHVLVMLQAREELDLKIARYWFSHWSKLILYSMVGSPVRHKFVYSTEFSSFSQVLTLRDLGHWIWLGRETQPCHFYVFLINMRCFLYSGEKILKLFNHQPNISKPSILSMNPDLSLICNMYQWNHWLNQIQEEKRILFY